MLRKVLSVEDGEFSNVENGLFDILAECRRFRFVPFEVDALLGLGTLCRKKVTQFSEMKEAGEEIEKGIRYCHEALNIADHSKYRLKAAMSYLLLAELWDSKRDDRKSLEFASLALRFSSPEGKNKAKYRFLSIFSRANALIQKIEAKGN